MNGMVSLPLKHNLTFFCFLTNNSLKRRFDQTQENVVWTISTHMTILADQILAQMDVDGLTRELRLRSRKRNSARQAVSRERPPSSLASSVDVVYDHDTRSEAPSWVSTSQYIVDPTQSESSPRLSTSGLQSWVESSGTPAEAAQPRVVNVPEGHATLSDSRLTFGTTTSATNGENASVADSVPVRHPIGFQLLRFILTMVCLVRKHHELVCHLRL